VLVRDGRSVTESLVRSFGFSYRTAIRIWAKAARIVRAFDTAHRDDPPYRLVRYEDFLADLRSELSAVLAFCGLPPSGYDFAAAEALPLQGSSTDRGGQAAVHWQSVPKPATFGGAARWAEWSRPQHRRFNAAAGDLLSAFGYEPEPVSVGLLSRARRRLDDVLYAVETVRFFRTTPQRRRIRMWRAMERAGKQR
jgi:hypothetical protein